MEPEQKKTTEATEQGKREEAEHTENDHAPSQQHEPDGREGSLSEEGEGDEAFADDIDDEFVDAAEELNAIIRENDHRRPHHQSSPLKSGEEGFGFDQPIVPLCVTTNYSGSRVCVGHTKGFILYVVRRVDAEVPLREAEADDLAFGDDDGCGNANTTADDRAQQQQPTRLDPFPASRRAARARRMARASGEPHPSAMPLPTSASASTSTSSGSRTRHQRLASPFSQLVPIVCFDEDDRLTLECNAATDVNGVRRPFAHLRRYGMPVLKEYGDGTSVASSAAKRSRQATGEFGEDDDDDDCSWGLSSNTLASSSNDVGNGSRPPSTRFAGVGSVALLFNTSYIGVVGGGPRPLGPQHKLHIFSRTTLVETITATAAIERIEMMSGSADRTTQVCMLTRDQIFHIYLFDGTLVYRAPTHTLNDSLSQPLAINSSKCIVSFPGKKLGGIEVARFADSANIRTICSIPHAHAHSISAIALSGAGDVCVTCSVNGTLIRVWSVAEGSSTQGQKLCEMRTSTAFIPCRIRHIGVSTNGSYIYALINSVNVSVFYIGKEEEAKSYDVSLKDPSKAMAKNQSSYFSGRLASYVTSYFETKWAVTTLGLPSTMLPLAMLKGAQYGFRRATAPSSAGGGGGNALSSSAAFGASSSSPNSNAAMLLHHRRTNDSSNATSAATTNASPSQASPTGGLWGRLYGASPPPVATPPPLGGGDPVSASSSPPPPSSSSATAAAAASAVASYYSAYAPGWVGGLYSAATQTVSAYISGGGGAASQPSQQEGAAVSSNFNNHHQHAEAPQAAKDVNGRTADDVLVLWWEQQAHMQQGLSMGADFLWWDRYDLEAYCALEEASAASSAAAAGRRGGKKAKGSFPAPAKEGGGDAASGRASSTDAPAASQPPTTAAAVATTREAEAEDDYAEGLKEQLCVANAYGELLRVTFMPIGGTLTTYPIVPPKE